MTGTGIEQLLELADAYPASHVYAGAGDGSRIYLLSLGEPRTPDREFLKLVIKEGFAVMMYHAHHERARQTFDGDLRAGMLTGFLEDLAYRLHEREMALQERGSASPMVEANGFGTVAGVTREFCNAGHRILRSRTN